MSLHKGDWFSQDIIASTNQVHIQYTMIPHYTEYSLIIVHSLLWIECYNYSGWWFSINSALYLWEWENILIISDELERSR